MIIGWWDHFEGKRKTTVRKRKTVLHWKRWMNEAGMD